MNRELETLMGGEREERYRIRTHAAGPEGSLPLSHELLLHSPSGDLFGWSQNAGMGWKPDKLSGKPFLILGTQGGIRGEQGEPIALGYHTGHWEIGLLMRAAARQLAEQGAVPFAGFVSDPCDGRTQGTPGMYDSLPYRNDAATVLRRLIRSLPTRKGVMGVGTCDKGLPAMMIALASMRELPGIIVPGGVTLPPTRGEDAGKIQTIGARYANGELTLQEAADLGCRACATPGGGCQFLGTAASAQVVAEALGMALPHSALAPSGQWVWEETASLSAVALLRMEARGLSMGQILTDASIRNAMAVHAAFGASTNLLLHLPAVAHAAGCRIPAVHDWIEINRRVPRLVSALPNGPDYHPTIRVFLAGGVPEVMLHLRELGLIAESALTASGHSVGQALDWWAASDRRRRMRARLRADGIDPDEVILSPDAARRKGLTATLTFPVGNLAPEGSVIKSTAIDPSVVSPDGVFRHTAKAKVFTTEKAAIKAIKSGEIRAGDIMVLIGRGPMGTGMEETYQLTSALKHLSYGKHVSLLTDARFSGVSTGACVGHIGPEALAGGPIGKLRDGDLIELVLDLNRLEGKLNFIGEDEDVFAAEEGARRLAGRDPHPRLAPDAELPEDTKLWAALQAVSGGTWGGTVYDTERIIAALEAGKKALGWQAQAANN